MGGGSSGGAGGTRMQAAQALAPDAATSLARYARFEDVLALIAEARDMPLLIEIENNLRLATYRPGHIEFEPGADARPDLAQRLGQRLQSLTGTRWAVVVVGEGGAPTVAEARVASQDAAHEAALALPLVQAVMAQFPGAKIVEVRPPVADATEAALPEISDEDATPDDWDPFEED